MRRTISWITNSASDYTLNFFLSLGSRAKKALFLYPKLARPTTKSLNFFWQGHPLSKDCMLPGDDGCSTSRGHIHNAHLLIEQVSRVSRFFKRHYVIQLWHVYNDYNGYSGDSVSAKCLKPGLKFEVPRIRINVQEAGFFFKPKACHQFAKHPSDLRYLLLNTLGTPDPPVSRTDI